MELGLKGKLVLVTASTDGIGFSIAQDFAQEGAIVYINGRTAKSVEDAINKLNEQGITGELRPAPADLSNLAGAKALIRSIPYVDILVNNLGIYEIKPFEDITDEDWLRFFEINVLSGIRLSRAYFPLMKKKNWGRVVFISSESGVNIPAEMIHYGMTKTAQLAVTRGMAETTVGTGVTVNSVLPGPPYSGGAVDFVKNLAATKMIPIKQAEEEFFKIMYPTSLIKRFATTDEVAGLVVFVCSERASAINGSALRVEGGCVRSVV